MDLAEFKKLSFERKIEIIKRGLTQDGVQRIVTTAEARQVGEGGDENYTYSGVASATAFPRDDFWGIDVNGIDTQNFMKNPAILPSHELGATIMPIGRATELVKSDGQLDITFLLDSNDELARQYKDKIDNGFLNALSIGFLPDFSTMEDMPDGRIIFRRSELLEVSLVGVGKDPDALLNSVRSMNSGNNDRVIEAYNAWKAEQDAEGEGNLIRDLPEVECIDAERTTSLEEDVIELIAEVARLRERNEELENRINAESELRKSEDKALSKRVNEVYDIIPDVEAERTQKINKVIENLK